jgi:hypothetical protein
MEYLGATYQFGFAVGKYLGRQMDNLIDTK